MRKYLCLALVVMFVIATAGVCYGSGGGALYAHGPDDAVQIETFVADAAADWFTATLGANNRILGYTFIAITAGKMGLFDTTSNASAMGGTGMVIEDSCAANTSNTVWFPFPLDITNNMYVYLEKSDSVLIVFYE